MLPTLFHTSLWYTPKSQRDDDSPAEFLIQTFPYHFLSVFQLSGSVAKIDGVHNNTIERTILEYCVLDHKNVSSPDGTFINPKDLVKVLPLEIINELLTFIFEISMYTDDFLSEMENSIYSVYNPRFQDESWGCDYCQERKLDRQRNCPFLPKEDHDPHITYPTHSGTVRECPMGNINVLLTNKAVEAHRYREQSLLPEDGGIRNQTVFFMIASQKVMEISNYYENKRMEEAKTS